MTEAVINACPTLLGFHAKGERVHKATPPRRKRHPQASMSPILGDQTRLLPKTPSKGVEPLGKLEPEGQAPRSTLGTTTCSHRHRALEATARPKSPDYRQTEPPTQTNRTPQPPKGSTAGSGSRRPKRREEHQGVKEELRAELGATKTSLPSMNLARISGLRETHQITEQPPQTKPPTQREARWGEEKSN
uniref:Uncharacterized protein n=1 Tax=Oryza nivara TaxID=4536 RepID=A0A0E0I3P7_ORYNI